MVPSYECTSWRWPKNRSHCLAVHIRSCISPYNVLFILLQKELFTDIPVGMGVPLLTFDLLITATKKSCMTKRTLNFQTIKYNETHRSSPLFLNLVHACKRSYNVVSVGTGS